jgi:hypothetical protein
MMSLALLVKQLDQVRFRVSAQRLLEEFIAEKPSDSEMEAAALYYASWLHAHCHHEPKRPPGSKNKSKDVATPAPAPPAAAAVVQKVRP